MKSKNHLSITGVIATDVTFLPARRLWRFSMIHHFGGHNPSLYLQCVFWGRKSEEILALGPKQGDSVSIDAYVRPCGDRFEAVLNDLSIFTGEKTIVQPKKE